MVVLPKLVAAEAVAHQLPISLVPSDIGYFPKAKRHYFERPNGSRQLILILCVQGKGWVRFDRREYSVAPGQLLVIRPNQPHSYGADAVQPWTIYWCHAAGSVAERFGESLISENTSPVLGIGDYPRLITLFTEMLDELEHGYGLSHLLLSSSALSYLLALIWKFSRVKGENCVDSTVRVRQVAEQLRQHPERAVSVGVLAAIANLSVSHFCNSFKRITGFAPVEYLLHIRIQRACVLLDTTDEPIKHIASEVGFSDPLYFSRVFTKVHGMSPSAYRSVRKG
jgi:AraC family transcriptional regulator of arabinose operon